MAVKIVGVSQAAVKRCVCRNCASELEYTLADTTTKTVSDYGGGRDTYRTLVCPKCYEEVGVSLY